MMELYVQTTVEIPPKKEMNFPPTLCLDEDYDENEGLKEFYQRSLPMLKACSWDLISTTILNDIAESLYETDSSDDAWRIFAEEMGINRKTMAKIKAGAFCNKVLPVFFAMDRIARQCLTFADIIKALLKTERFNVLREIKSFVQDLLSKIPDGQTNNSVSSIQHKNETTLLNTTEKSPISLCEQKCEFNVFQQHSLCSDFESALEISNSPKPPLENSKEIKVPSAPAEERITILIQHAESENNIAKELSSQFATQGMIATTLSEVNDLTLIEPVNVLDTVFSEVDFIVPVLSEKLMDEIYPANHEEYLESVHAKNNKRLHSLILQEYSYNRCNNFRVRPVIVEGFSRRPVNGLAQRLLREPVYALSFRLPNEISKLIQVLKKTKKLRPLQQIQ